MRPSTPGSATRRRAGRLLRVPSIAAGLGLVAGFVLLGFFAPWIAPHDPNATLTTTATPPSWQYPMGTNKLGQDVLSRVIWGARVSEDMNNRLRVMTIITGVNSPYVLGKVDHTRPSAELKRMSNELGIEMVGRGGR